jgi:hypothetical protein
MSDPAPYGWDEYTHTERIPKPAPKTWRWLIGPVTPKDHQPSPGPPGTPPTGDEDLTMQLTADQQVQLSITGKDAYGNDVTITGNTQWSSSDPSVVDVEMTDSAHATAAAVGPVGAATVTVTNDVDNDGTGDYIGSLAVNVVAGKMTEIEIEAGEPEPKP